MSNVNVVPQSRSVRFHRQDVVHGAVDLFLALYIVFAVLCCLNDKLYSRCINWVYRNGTVHFNS